LIARSASNGYAPLHILVGDTSARGHERDEVIVRLDCYSRVAEEVADDAS
jgi:hypothetical protein